MGELSYKIDSKADRGTRQAIDWLVKRGGVTPEQIDGDGGQPRDHVLNFKEFVHFVYNSPDWQKYLPALDKAGLKHPLDPRKIPHEIIRRASYLRSAVEHQTQTMPGITGYCDAFVPAYYEEGLKSYAEGGLGWGYPFAYRRTQDRELTAAEGYNGVLNPKLPFGECTEATYKIISAFRAAGVPCTINTFDTQNHLFARFDQTDLDPSKLGKIGWERSLSDSGMAFIYYSNLLAAAKKPDLTKRYEDIATAIDPDSVLAHKLRVLDLVKNKRFDEACEEIFKAMALNPEEPTIFTMAASLFMSHPEPNKGRELAHRLIESYPNNAYALRAFQSYCYRRNTCSEEGPWLMQRFPQSGNGEVLMALQVEKNGQTGEITEWVSKSLEKNPRNAIALQMKAILALQTGRYEEAEQAYKASIEVAPNLAGNHSGLSAIYTGRGLVDAAYDEAKREEIVFLGNPSGEMALANAALQAGDFETALIYAANHQTKYPADPTSYLTLSSILTNHGYFDKAIDQVKQALPLISHPSGRAGTYAYLASLYLMKPDLDKARAYVQLAKNTDLNNLAVIIVDIQVLMAQNLYDQALVVADEGVKKFPESSASWALRATLHMTLNHTAQAKADIEKSLSLNPRDPIALMNEIFLLLEKGNSKAAREKLTEIRIKFSAFPFLHVLDAFASYLLGDSAKAATEAKRALKYNPNDHQALLTFGFIYVDRNELQQAAEKARQLKKFFPFQNSGFLLMAKIYQKQERLKEAEAEAREAVRIFPYDSGRIPKISTYQTLIEILDAEGKTDEAVHARAAMMKNRTTPEP